LIPEGKSVSGVGSDKAAIRLELIAALLIKRYGVECNMNERKMLVSFFWMTIYIISFLTYIVYPDWYKAVEYVMLLSVVFATIPLIYGWE
jgi:hypothetical protein